MKNLKPYVAGLLTAFLICGLISTATANTGKVMQELEYRDIRVSLDGKILDLRNAIGEKVEPFMFGGTNYLPVRALAEALGLNVAWDGKEVMVVLTTPESKTVSTATPTPVQAQGTGTLTKAQENALRQARTYLDIMAFSYSGLISQLEYEGYNHADAVYAVDQCGADWNEQAVRKAADYLNMMAFSKDGLIEQLEYEGFTHEQAEYGVTANGY